MNWKDFIIRLENSCATVFGKNVVKSLSTHEFDISYKDSWYTFMCPKCRQFFKVHDRDLNRNDFNLDNVNSGWRYWLISCDETIIKDIIE
jgi:hypothetical protein